MGVNYLSKVGKVSYAINYEMRLIGPLFVARIAQMFGFYVFSNA